MKVLLIRKDGSLSFTVLDESMTGFVEAWRPPLKLAVYMDPEAPIDVYERHYLRRGKAGPYTIFEEV